MMMCSKIGLLLVLGSCAMLLLVQCEAAAPLKGGLEKIFSPFHSKKKGKVSESKVKDCVALCAVTPTTGELAKDTFQRRACGPKDVYIEISYCGMCYSDYHTVHGEWGWDGAHPVVPGHEITGVVAEVGSEVRRFRAGDRVGVGCFVGSCSACPSCKAGDIQYCDEGAMQTYNWPHPTDTVNPITLGGYSKSITVDQDFVLKIPKNMPMDAGAPLLCAGITMWSPLVHFEGARKGGKKVGIVGFGGLGHMGVKLAKAMGNEVFVFSTSPRKKADIEALGATFVQSTDEEAMRALGNTLDLIIDTANVPHLLAGYLATLKAQRTFCMVGADTSNFTDVNAFSVLMRRISIGGSLVGGIKETQDMLNFCAKHGITADIELIGADEANSAMKALKANAGASRRFVLDIQNTL
ncbi:unnamed protein product [Heterosigma akashiwo]|uniref:Enoyl reductase (ER) domain-containing protein n=1 Tax=Heterosigma akashiwo TaxID=2829 RepID=A0A6V1PBF6_HETAK|mmetsp:Transcript_13141/g.18308  ORF Transcript_13141/g.18308 Transcript_13141/m.18308 type:complete len:409 (+) Transcript_13141:44-1270(+)